MDCAALGRLKQRRGLSESGATLASEGFAYEPGNSLQYHTNALGGVTEYAYTTTGAKRFCKQADGVTNGWTFYLDGRPAKEILNNGSYWLTTYDDGNRQATRKFYSKAGTALATNVAELDRRGNVVRAVDAGGFTSTNRFDGLDRIKLAAGPAMISISPTNLPTPGGPVTSIVQQVSTYLYDSSGKVLTVSNALRERIITTRDAMARVVRAEVLGSNGATVRLTTTAYGANHHGVSVTNGSGAAAIATTVYTDHDGRPLLNIGYPSAGTREFTLSEYNRAGSLITQTRNSAAGAGAPYLWSFHHLYYDELERNNEVFDRDGADTFISFDPAGNATNRVMPGGVKWVGKFDNAGRMLSEYNTGTGLNARTNTYAYFAAGSPFAGLLQTRTDGRGVACAYGYDEWLRVATNVHTGSLPRTQSDEPLHV